MKKHTESLITFIKVNRIDRYLYPRLLHNDHHYHFLCRDPHIPPGHSPGHIPHIFPNPVQFSLSMV